MNTDADHFLHALGERLTFQTFGEGNAKGNRTLSRIVHGTFAEHADTLASFNERGAGVFVMVNEGNGKGRKAASVRRVRAYFADFDGTTPPDVASVLLAPHVTIESSPQHWHWYWWIDGAPLDAFKAVQVAIAGRFGSDPKVCDLPRVMRLPGFLHRKDEPFLTRIVTLRNAPRYTHAEFVRAFRIDVNAPAASKQVRSTDGSNVTQLPTARKRHKLPAIIPEGERNTRLLSLAAGFVRKGYGLQAVNDRMQRINAERCTPPLGADEVDTIAARAMGYGSEGFAMLPHALLDSAEWKSLTPRAHDIIVMAFRRYNGSNNGNIALTWEDFDGLPGFGQKHTFYKHRARAVQVRILRATRMARNTQNGKTPDLFGIDDRWLPGNSASVKKGTLRQCQKRNPYIHKQEGELLPLLRLRIQALGERRERNRRGPHDENETTGNRSRVPGIPGCTGR